MVTILQSQVTKTGTFNGTAVSVSSLPTYGTVQIKVDALTTGAEAQFEVQSSADGFNSDVKTEAQWNFYGPIGSVYPVAQDKHEYDMPGIRLGVSSAQLRVVLSYLTSASSVTYEAYLIQ